MGYTTKFDGEFAITPSLQHTHWVYLRAFAEIRHMRRDAAQAEQVEDEARIAVGLPIGDEGEYFVAQEWSSPSVIDPDHPPSGQPGLWCQWIPNEQGTALVWNRGESFYDYRKWLEYLIGHFLAPWGYVLSGTIQWQDEEAGDSGTITVENNQVVVHKRSVANHQPDQLLANNNTARYQATRVEADRITAPSIRRILDMRLPRPVPHETYLVTVLGIRQPIQVLYLVKRQELGIAWGDNDDASWSSVPDLPTGLERYLFDRPQWKKHQL